MSVKIRLEDKKKENLLLGCSSRCSLKKSKYLEKSVSTPAAHEKRRHKDTDNFRHLAY
jgi:hypothetical protein